MPGAVLMHRQLAARLVIGQEQHERIAGDPGIFKLGKNRTQTVIDPGRHGTLARLLRSHELCPGNLLVCPTWCKECSTAEFTELSPEVDRIR